MFRKRKTRKKTKQNQKAIDLSEISESGKAKKPDRVKEKPEAPVLDSADLQMIEKMVDQGQVHEMDYQNQREKLLESIRTKSKGNFQRSQKLENLKKQAKPDGKTGGYSGSVPIDYNPSRCADFFRTGFCGFGNSCIYAHVRGEYQFGWQQEKEWKQNQR